MEDFERFVQARSVALLRTAFLLTGDRHLAEDLLQDTLARVAQHWVSVARDGNPEAYTRRVLYHRAVDTWRARRRRPAEVAAQPAGDSADYSTRWTLTSAWCSGLRWPGSHPSSALSSSCASTKSTPRPRPPPSSGAR